MLKIIVGGASGKMGKAICEMAGSKNDYSIIATLNSQNSNKTYLSSLNTNVNAFIDFSNPLATIKYVEFCLKYKIPMVIGTTGFCKNDYVFIENAANNIPILLSANTSLSVNILFKLSEIVASSLRKYDVEIIETHHKFKKDAPSGTALKIGQHIAKGRNLNFDEIARYEYHQLRNNDDIGFAVVRGGNVVGKHEVNFFGLSENLQLTSEITDRSCFAEGAITAAKFISRQKAGLYSMADVLGINNV